MFVYIKRMHIFCLILSAIILTTGCSEQQKKDIAKDPLEEDPLVQEVVEQVVTEQEVTEEENKENTPEISAEDPEQDVSGQTEPVTEQAEPSQEDTQAVGKLEFAVRYMASAKKGILTYSQAVVLCRDIIKEYPGTEYETQARELLKQVPADQRSRYNITDEELGL